MSKNIENILKNMEYPDCFTSHKKCLTCPGFGQECIDKVNEIDRLRYEANELSALEDENYEK